MKPRSIEWYELICELLQLKASHGLGCARVWAAVNRDDYKSASTELNNIISRLPTPGNVTLGK